MCKCESANILSEATALSFKIFLIRDTAFQAQKTQGGKLNLLNERTVYERANCYSERAESAFKLILS